MADQNVITACTCPGTPHETDRIRLVNPLPFTTAIICRQALAAEFAQANESGERPSEAELSGVLFEVYLLHCVQAWTRTDAKRKALPVNRVNLRAFMADHPVEAAAVADAANELYVDKVVLPLLQAALTSSQPTPTESSTSARNGRSRTSRKRSSRSSITSIPTANTGTTITSPAGGSSSSRSSGSAA